MGWSERNFRAKSSASVLAAAWAGVHPLKLSKVASATEAGMPTRLKSAMRSSRRRQAHGWATTVAPLATSTKPGAAAALAGGAAGAAPGPRRLAEHLLHHVLDPAAGTAGRGLEGLGHGGRKSTPHSPEPEQAGLAGGVLQVGPQRLAVGGRAGERLARPGPEAAARAQGGALGGR